MREFAERKILYFDEPGPQNTDAVIGAVVDRLADGGIRHVVVASITGETALKVAEKLRGREFSVVCVSGFPGWITMRNVEHPFVMGELREKLEGLGSL